MCGFVFGWKSPIIAVMFSQFICYTTQTPANNLLAQAYMQPNSTGQTKRHNLFIVACKHLPTGLLATAIGIAALSAPFLYNLLRNHGVDSFIGGALATGAVIVVVPTLFLYFVTLLRSPTIRTRVESEAERELEIMTREMEALQEKEKKEEEQVRRLESMIDGDVKVRKEIE
jgi:hypothetical protein